MIATDDMLDIFDAFCGAGGSSEGARQADLDPNPPPPHERERDDEHDEQETRTA